MVNPELKVDIVRFVDDYQPGIVECQFTDAEGHRYSIVDKIPRFTAENIWSGSEYPRVGAVRCRILGGSTNTSDRQLL